MKQGTKKAYFLLIGFVLFVIFHNSFYALFGIEEPVFFLLALLSGVAFLVFTLISLTSFFMKGEPKDLWQLGWLGLLGLVGVLPSFSNKFYCLFGFLFFFSLKLIQVKK